MALTIYDARARVETDLPDSALQRILTSAVKAVDRSAGKADSETRTFVGHGTAVLPFARRVASITSVTERRSPRGDETALSANDYRLVGSYRLLRLTGGDNGASYWGWEVVVVYVPEVDAAVRDRVALDLVQIDVEFRALDREKVGDWEGEQKDYKKRRRALLAQVRESTLR